MCIAEPQLFEIFERFFRKDRFYKKRNWEKFGITFRIAYVHLDLEFR